MLPINFCVKTFVCLLILLDFIYICGVCCTCTFHYVTLWPVCLLNLQLHVFHIAPLHRHLYFLALDLQEISTKKKTKKNIKVNAKKILMISVSWQLKIPITYNFIHWKFLFFSTKMAHGWRYYYSSNEMHFTWWMPETWIFYE